MAKYGPPAMVRTPWGNAGELRAQKLNPGLGTPREEVERSQRERLFAATVAVVATKGYEAMSVGDLVGLSGVSRRTFYEHFADKQACFVATVETILNGAVAVGSQGFAGEGPWEKRGLSALRRFMDLIAAQPAAARMCIVDAHAAGPAAMAQLETALERLATLAAGGPDGKPKRRGTPPELTRAVIGGLHQVVYRHLHDGREAELPGRAEEIWRWVASHRPPPRPLRARSRRVGGDDGVSAPPFAAHIRGERILRGFAAAVAEKGYAAATIADIAAQARISQATFYAHFSGKEDALFAALDSSGAQMVGATLPAVRRSGSWAEGMRTAIASMFAFLAAEPAFARLRAVEAYAAGPVAVEHRDRAAAEAIAVALALDPDAPTPAPLEIEATIGALNRILYERVAREGPQALPGAVPLAVYVALTPALGAERACAIALGAQRTAHA
jgi:AcrR family transcriptional regulator